MAGPARRIRSPAGWIALSLSGRLSRRIYWPSYIAVLALNFSLYFQLLKVVNTAEPAASAVLVIALGGVGLAYVNIAISVKRLHDIGYSGFLAVAVLIPFINLAFSIWVGIIPGTPDANPYGEQPDVPPP